MLCVQAWSSSEPSKTAPPTNIGDYIFGSGSWQRVCGWTTGSIIIPLGDTSGICLQVHGLGLSDTWIRSHRKDCHPQVCERSHPSPAGLLRPQLVSILFFFRQSPGKESVSPMVYAGQAGTDSSARGNVWPTPAQSSPIIYTWGQVVKLEIFLSTILRKYCASALPHMGMPFAGALLRMKRRPIQDRGDCIHPHKGRRARDIYCMRSYSSKEGTTAR